MQGEKSFIPMGYDKKKSENYSEEIPKEVEETIKKICSTASDSDYVQALQKSPLFSVVLASHKALSGEKINFDSLEDLEKSKPLKDLDIMEFGFGHPKDSHYLFFSKFGPHMYGVEPGEDSVELMRSYAEVEKSDREDANTSQPADDIKVGYAEDIPKLFPGKKFDVIFSSRVLEEYPMAGDGFLGEGEGKAKDILIKTSKSLKDGGLSIHSTTMPFILENIKLLEGLGYKVIIMNKDFPKEARAGDNRFYTILQKQHILEVAYAPDKD